MRGDWNWHMIIFTLVAMAIVLAGTWTLVRKIMEISMQLKQKMSEATTDFMRQMRPITRWSDLTDDEQAALSIKHGTDDIWITETGWNTTHIAHCDEHCQYLRGENYQINQGVKQFRKCYKCR